MPSIFDALMINKLRLPNRFVRSATYDNLADHGMVTDAQINLYDTLSQGGIGLIISGGLYPTKCLIFCKAYFGKRKLLAFLMVRRQTPFHIEVHRENTQHADIEV